jgi:hypothetical protein
MANADRFLAMSVSEFRAFKKAYRVLLAVGMHYDQAADILIAAIESRKADRKRRDLDAAMFTVASGNKKF